MQLFQCPACKSPLYFHNTECACGRQVAYDPDRQIMQLEGAFCANRDRIGCNWVAETGGLCRSCAMTETVPDLVAPDNLPLWTRTERAKRWMLANLARWGWFTRSDTGRRPVFQLLSEQTATGETKVTMGHADGTITINVTEASDAVRAERQEQLGELYRTMLGHMRHEMAHFLFVRLSQDETFLNRFRELFGDERADYGEALKAHYANPRAPDETHITSYATSHPHEDWAETISHLLHLVDLLDSAVAAGLSLKGGPAPGYDAYAERDGEALIDGAIAVAIAINHVNRAVDVPDLYPFVIPRGVRTKLAFAYDHLRTDWAG